MKKDKVSLSVIRRLPRYFRYLSDMMANGMTRISSKELSQRMGITASQIRQDLNCFGGFGQQGYGYNIEALYNEIKVILGAEDNNTAIIVGMGNLGTALAHNMNFIKRGVFLTGLFDISEHRIGKEINGMQIRNVSEIEAFCSDTKKIPDIAVLTLPKQETQAMAELLEKCGIKGLWNFANMELKLKKAVVENVHMGDSLMLLCYALKEDSGE